MEIHFSLEQKSSHSLPVITNFGDAWFGVLVTNAVYKDGTGASVLMLRQKRAIGRSPYVRVRCANNVIPLVRAFWR